MSTPLDRTWPLVLDEYRRVFSKCAPVMSAPQRPPTRGLVTVGLDTPMCPPAAPGGFLAPLGSPNLLPPKEV